MGIECKWRKDPVLMLFAGVLTLLCLTSLIASVAARLVHEQDLFKSPQVQFGATLVLQIAIMVLVGFFLKVHAVSWSEFLGLDSSRVGTKLLIGIGLGIVAVPLLLGLNQICGSILTRLNSEPVEQNVITMLREAKGVSTLTIQLLSAVVFAPVVEESLLRGVMYPALKGRLPPWGSMLCTSILFGAIHANALTFVPLTVFAMLLVWLYENTGTLAASILAHAAFNLSNFVMVRYQSELSEFLKHLRE